MSEIWLPIDNKEKYFVSNLGNVKSVKNGTEKILNQHTSMYGYKMVKVGNKLSMAHRLVAKAFVENKTGGNTVLFKDGDKSNTHADNLYWTYRKHPREKITLMIDKDTGKVIKEFPCMMEAARYLDTEKVNTAVHGIHNAIYGRFKTYKGYVWRYKEQMSVEEMLEREG